jgi:SOS-response transcriptional repressor LexA
MTNTRPLPDVAEKRRLILAFIKARCSDGNPPSLREIGVHANLSHVAVMRHLRAMQADGQVYWRIGEARGIRPTLGQRPKT